jgi:hypothetical protein
LIKQEYYYNNQTPHYFKFDHDHEASSNFRKTPFEGNNFEFYISKNEIHLLKVKIIKNSEDKINICLLSKRQV